MTIRILSFEYKDYDFFVSFQHVFFEISLNFPLILLLFSGWLFENFPFDQSTALTEKIFSGRRKDLRTINCEMVLFPPLPVSHNFHPMSVPLAH